MNSISILQLHIKQRLVNGQKIAVRLLRDFPEAYSIISAVIA